MAVTAKIAVENAAYSFDKLYDYAVPPGLALAPGQRVTVPFGRGDSLRLGLVLSLEEAPEPLPAGIKAVRAAADPEPLLTPELLRLLRWLRAETFCTWFEGLRAILPGGYGVKSRTLWSLCRGRSTTRRRSPPRGTASWPPWRGGRKRRRRRSWGSCWAPGSSAPPSGSWRGGASSGPTTR